MYKMSRCAYSRGYGLKYQASTSCLPICNRLRFLTRAISETDWVIEPPVRSFSSSCSLLNESRGRGGAVGASLAVSMASSISPSASSSPSSSSSSSREGDLRRDGLGEVGAGGAGEGLGADDSLGTLPFAALFFGCLRGALAGGGALPLTFFCGGAFGRGHSSSRDKTTRDAATHSSRRLLN